MKNEKLKLFFVNETGINCFQVSFYIISSFYSLFPGTDGWRGGGKYREEPEGREERVEWMDIFFSLPLCKLFPPTSLFLYFFKASVCIFTFNLTACHSYSLFLFLFLFLYIYFFLSFFLSFSFSFLLPS